ncbi:MAG: hypothetical protein R3F36_13260 [Candidatus Competibacteraceae bacterium]
MAALKTHYPHARFSGVVEPGMIEQGLRSLVPLERLAVIDWWRYLRHLPELLRIRRRLYRELLADPLRRCSSGSMRLISVWVWNLKLRICGVPTVHYVSPSVWAWRPWRVRKIARSVDLMLTLLPFEAAFYQRRPCRCVMSAIRWPMPSPSA